MDDFIRFGDLDSWNKLWNSPQRFQWFCGGYGSGKTTFGVAEAFTNVMFRHVGYEGIVAAPTYSLLWQAWFKEWTKWFAPLTGLWTLSRDSKRGDKIEFCNGSSILLRSTSVPASNEGVNAAWVIFDEATRESSHESFRVLAGRIRRGNPNSIRQFLLTGPPGSPGHWSAEEFGTRPGLGFNNAYFNGDALSWHNRDHVVVRARTKDNVHLAAGYEEDLRSQPGATKAWCDRFLDAVAASSDSAIWPMFDPGKHVVPAREIPHDRLGRTISGVDWGFSHPGVILTGKLTREGDLYIVGEEVHKGLLVADLKGQWVPIAREQVVKKHRSREFYCDPSSPNNIGVFSEGLYPLGVQIYPANNDVSEGIRCVGARLEAVESRHKLLPGARVRGLWISDECKETIKAMQGYEYKTIRGAATEIPAEIKDDPCDALRYLVMGV